MADFRDLASNIIHQENRVGSHFQKCALVQHQYKPNEDKCGAYNSDAPLEFIGANPALPVRELDWSVFDDI